MRFLFWGILSHARSLGTTQRGGALLLFVLRAVAGACVGRWTGQPRMPPQERQHEGFWFFLWCVSFPLSGHMLPEHVLAGGYAGMEGVLEVEILG